MAVLSGAMHASLYCGAMVVLPVGTGFKSLQASHFEEGGYKQEALYRTIT